MVRNRPFCYTVVILNSIVSNSDRILLDAQGKISMYFPPEDPIIAISNN